MLGFGVVGVTLGVGDEGVGDGVDTGGGVVVTGGTTTGGWLVPGGCGPPGLGLADFVGVFFGEGDADAEPEGDGLPLVSEASGDGESVPPGEALSEAESLGAGIV